MYSLRKNKISVKQIVSFLNASYIGRDFEITSLSSLNDIKNNSVLFYSDLINVKFQIKDNITYDLKNLEKFHDVLLISTNEIKKKINVPVIPSKNPRLDFQRVAMEFFADDEFKPGTHNTAVVEENAIIGKNVFVGAHCYIGKNTKSTIISKGISTGKGQNTYRGLVRMGPKATNGRNFTQCDSLLIGDKCGAHTIPYIEVKNQSAKIEHEATTSKISDDQMFYCRQRGLDQENAVSLIVNGFCKEVLKELPMEFAVEAQKLLGISLEGSVG